MNTKITDKIEINKDKKLSDLECKVVMLQSEEIPFILSDITKNEKGRTMRDVATDEVRTVQEMNLHLRNNYKNNIVAKRWIACNEFLVTLLREQYDIN